MSEEYLDSVDPEDVGTEKIGDTLFVFEQIREKVDQPTAAMLTLACELSRLNDLLCNTVLNFSTIMEKAVDDMKGNRQ